MNIKIKNTPEQKALFAAIGSKDKTESLNAQEAFGSFITPVVQEALMQASTLTPIYKTVQYNEDDSPSIPLDLFFDEGTEYVQVWSQEMAGGLGTSHVEGMKEMKFSTYVLNSAVSFNKKYARKCRLNVLEKAIARMINEIVVKQERNGWIPIIREAVEGNVNGVQTTFRTNATNIFGIDDLNKMITRMSRLNQSFAGGTPANFAGRLTNIIGSPEFKELIRGFSYQSMNTYQATSGTSSIPLPDAVRTEIFRAAGASSIFGIEISAINELGIGQKYNTLTDTLAGSTTFAQADGTTGAAAFAATDEIVFGFDLTRDNFIRPVIAGEDSAELAVLPDDQFFTRQEKVGFFTQLEEGRVGLDARATTNIIIT